MSPYLLPVLAAEASITTPEDWSVITTALTNQISVSTVVGVLAVAVASCAGLVFMWWGVRKVTSMIMAALKRGKLRI